MLLLIACGRPTPDATSGAAPAPVQMRHVSAKGRHFQSLSVRLQGDTLRVLLPHPLVRGERVTGLIHVGGGLDGKGVIDQPANPFRDHTLSVAGTSHPLNQRSLDLELPNRAGEMMVELRDPRGQAVAVGRLVVRAAGPPVPELDPGEIIVAPPYVTSTGLMTLKGRFDGDAASTSLLLGGEEVEVWMESGNLAITPPSRAEAGVHELLIEDGLRRQWAQVRVLRATVEPEDAELSAGESLSYTVSVRGLEGFRFSLRPVIVVVTISSITDQSIRDRRGHAVLRGDVQGDTGTVHGVWQAPSDARVRLWAYVDASAAPGSP